jgi:hypothetical protein
METGHSVVQVAETGLSSFNKYGLPGLIIGVLFTINGALTYALVTVVNNNTAVLERYSNSNDRLTSQIEDLRREVQFNRSKTGG